MLAVIQRVQRASVHVDSEAISSIGPGLLTLLGVERGDTDAQLEKLISRILNLRIFADEAGKMNLSLLDVKGAHLIVSQFTLAGDCSGGRRPSFTTAEAPERARELYDRAIALSAGLGAPTQGGRFQADMKVELVNDGPATFLLRP